MAQARQYGRNSVDRDGQHRDSHCFDLFCFCWAGAHEHIGGNYRCPLACPSFEAMSCTAEVLLGPELALKISPPAIFDQRVDRA